MDTKITIKAVFVLFIIFFLGWSYAAIEILNPYKYSYTLCLKEYVNLSKELKDTQNDYSKLKQELCDLGIFEFCETTAQMRGYDCNRKIGYSFNCQQWRGFKLCKNITCSGKPIIAKIVFLNTTQNNATSSN